MDLIWFLVGCTFFLVSCGLVHLIGSLLLEE